MAVAEAQTDISTRKDQSADVFLAFGITGDLARVMTFRSLHRLEIDGVAPGSTTQTYAASRLEIDNWRWAGVRFFIRTGKLLPVTQTELRLVFRHPPRLGFLSEGARAPAEGQLVVKLDPTTGVRLELDAHRADKGGPQVITLDMEFAQEGGEDPTPYEVLLHAAMDGDNTPFTRRTASRRRGGSWRRCWMPGRRCIPTHRGRGVRRRPIGSSGAWVAGMSRGWRHERRRAEGQSQGSR